MKRRLGVTIISFFLLFTVSFVLFESFGAYLYSKLSEEQRQELSNFSEGHRFSLFDQEPKKWVLPDVELRIVGTCKGYLPEEFGFNEPLPKLIVFFNTTKSSPQIVSARIRNINLGRSSFNEVSTQGILDANYELQVDEMPLRAEHGSLAALRFLDSRYDTRRYDNLIEEAAFLCTKNVRDGLQQEIEMEDFKQQIENRASAYVAIEWPIRSKEARLDVFYELENRIHKSSLALDLRVL
jgi:hypothetical protein